MPLNRGRAMGTKEDLWARWRSLLMAARQSCNSVELKLTLAGALLQQTPRTSVGLIWRVQFAEVIEQAKLLDRAIALLEALAEDAEDLSK